MKEREKTRDKKLRHLEEATRFVVDTIHQQANSVIFKGGEYY